MNEVFISYSRRDELFARKLAADLDRDGLDVWIDVEDIPPGANWSNAINDGLNKADLMLLILTPTSVDSKNVEDEWQYFHNLGKPLIPLWLEPSGRLHYQLARLQYIDFAEQDYEEAYDAMLVEMRNKGFEVERLAETIAKVEAQRTEAEQERDRLQREIDALEKAAAERDRLRRELDAVQVIDEERQRLKDKLDQLHQEEALYEQVKESEQKRQTATDTSPMSALNVMPDIDTVPKKSRELGPNATATEPPHKQDDIPTWQGDAVGKKATDPAPRTSQMQSQFQSKIDVANAPRVDARQPRYPRKVIFGALGVIALFLFALILSGLLAGRDSGDGDDDEANPTNSNDEAVSQIVQFSDFGNDQIKSVDWNPNGDSIALGSTNGQVYIYRVVGDIAVINDIEVQDEFYLLRSIDFEVPVMSVAWNHDGTELAVYPESGSVSVWNVYEDDPEAWYEQAGVYLLSEDSSCEGAPPMVWHKDRNWLAVGCPHSLFLWDVDTDTWTSDELPSGGVIEDLAWSRTDIPYLAVVENSETISIWSINRDDPDEDLYPDLRLELADYEFEYPSGGVADLAWNGSFLAIGGISGGQSEIEFWYVKPEDDDVYQEGNLHWDFELDEISFNADGDYLTALDRETNMLGFWNVYADDTELTEYEYTGNGKIWTLDWHPWNEFFVTSELEFNDSSTAYSIWQFHLEPHNE